MRTSTAIFVGLVAGALTGCTYERFVQSELKIPNVFVPPSAEFTPYSIVAYSEESNFQTVCHAKLLIAPMKWEEFYQTYLADEKGSSVATVRAINSGTYSLEVKLLPAEVADIGVKYNGTYKVRINFSNGKVFSANDGAFTVGTLLRAMTSNEKCADSLRAFEQDPTKKKFMMVNSVFRYDTDVSVEGTDSIPADAAFQPAVKDLVLRKAALKMGSGEEKTFTGGKLYVGFRGLIPAIPETNASQDTKIAALLAASEAKLAEARAAEIRANTAAKAADEARAAAEAKLVAQAKSVAEAKSLAAEKSAEEKRASEADRTAAAAREQEAGRRAEGQRLAAEAAAAAARAQVTTVASGEDTAAPSQPAAGAIPATGPVASPKVPLAETATTGTPDGVVKAVDVTALVKEVVAVRKAQQVVTQVAEPPALQADPPATGSIQSGVK